MSRVSSSPARRKKERFRKWRAILFKTAEAMLQDDGVKVFVMVHRSNISYTYNSEQSPDWMPVEENSYRPLYQQKLELESEEDGKICDKSESAIGDDQNHPGVRDWADDSDALDANHIKSTSSTEPSVYDVGSPSLASTPAEELSEDCHTSVSGNTQPISEALHRYLQPPVLRCPSDFLCI